MEPLGLLRLEFFSSAQKEKRLLARVHEPCSHLFLQLIPAPDPARTLFPQAHEQATDALSSQDALSTGKLFDHLVEHPHPPAQ
jgi:hypothetical protein